MASEESPHFETNTRIFWKALGMVTFAGGTMVFFFAIRYILWRKQFSKLIPGRHPSVFSPSGNLREIPLSKQGRNGQTLIVFLLQGLGGYMKLLKEFDLFCLWMFYSPVIVFVKAAAIEALLNNPKTIERAWFYKYIKPVLGTGLITSDAKKWKSRRKLLNPCFSLDVVKSYIPIMNEQSGILVKCLKEEINNEFTDISTFLSLCTFDVICETVFGTRINAQSRGERAMEVVQSVHRGMELIMERISNCLYWFDFIYQFTRNSKEMKKCVQLAEDITTFVIQHKKEKFLKEELEADKGRRRSLMDILLKHHLQSKDFSEEDIKEEIVEFAVVGQHSTAKSLAWALYLIGLNMDIQEKAQKELDWIFGEDFDRHVTEEDLKDMKYLECVIKESFRLYPAVPLFGREATEDIKICSYTVPKGSTCLVTPYFLHRDEEVFPDAEKFNPDRFLPQNSANRHPYSYIPFSAGSRNCIGRAFATVEAKIILSALLRNYTFESLQQRDEILPTPDLVLRPSKPLKIRIRPRHS